MFSFCLVKKKIANEGTHTVRKIPSKCKRRHLRWGAFRMDVWPWMLLKINDVKSQKQIFRTIWQFERMVFHYGNLNSTALFIYVSFWPQKKDRIKRMCRSTVHFTQKNYKLMRIENPSAQISLVELFLSEKYAEHTSFKK